MSQTETNKRKVNLGCGSDQRSGFINVDIREEVNPDVVADLRDLPFEDSTVDKIVMQDVLEHFADWDVVLKECKRVLDIDGEILVRVPDWEKISDSDFWKERPFDKCENKVLGGRTDEYDVHKSLWTWDIAGTRFKQIGFKDIEMRKFNEPPIHWHLGIKAQNSDK